MASPRANRPTLRALRRGSRSFRDPGRHRTGILRAGGRNRRREGYAWRHVGKIGSLVTRVAEEAGSVVGLRFEIARHIVHRDHPRG